jgi:hypothetical protein
MTNPRTHTQARNFGLVTRYGITQEDYMLMLEAQKGVCKICGNPPRLKDHKVNKDNSTYLHVDHDHTTGRVRGLLCGRCNKGLGQFRDNPEFLAKAALYVRSYR